MRVTIDVDEKVWKELTDYILRKHRTLYGKHKKGAVNDVIRFGLKALKKSNVEDFKTAIATTNVADSFLESATEISKEIRKRGTARVEMA